MLTMYLIDYSQCSSCIHSMIESRARNKVADYPFEYIKPSSLSNESSNSADWHRLRAGNRRIRRQRAAASAHLNGGAAYRHLAPSSSHLRMFQELSALIQGLGETLLKIAPVSIALGAAFAVLSFFWACNPGRPWWRKRDLVTDL